MTDHQREIAELLAQQMLTGPIGFANQKKLASVSGLDVPFWEHAHAQKLLVDMLMREGFFAIAPTIGQEGRGTKILENGEQRHYHETHPVQGTPMGDGAPNGDRDEVQRPLRSEPVASHGSEGTTEPIVLSPKVTHFRFLCSRVHDDGYSENLEFVANDYSLSPNGHVTFHSDWSNGARSAQSVRSWDVIRCLGPVRDRPDAAETACLDSSTDLHPENRNPDNNIIEKKADGLTL